MAIKINYYNGDDELITCPDNRYQCEYPSRVSVEDMYQEIAYITEKNPVTGDSQTITMEVPAGYLFKEGYLYFVRIVDRTTNNELAEYTRIYQIGYGPHDRSYGICESKCKVPLPNMFTTTKKLAADIGWDSLTAGAYQTFTFDRPNELADEDPSQWRVETALTHMGATNPVPIEAHVIWMPAKNVYACHVFMSSGYNVTLRSSSDIMISFTFVKNV